MADRYLLESSAVDGYLLEDGTGVFLLDGTTNTPITPTVGGINAAGVASINDRGILGSVGIIGISGVVPRNDRGIVSGIGALLLSGFAPTIQATDFVSITPEVGSLSAYSESPSHPHGARLFPPSMVRI